METHLLPDSARIDNGRLSIGGCDVETLADEYGTPLFIYDEEHLRSRCREAVEAFGPNVAYASKAFLCVAMAQLVHEEGMAIDVSTGGEMYIALAAGVPAARLVFHGNNKSTPELQMALDAGMGRIVVDSLDEIRRIEDLVEDGADAPSVLLRINPGIEAHYDLGVDTRLHVHFPIRSHGVWIPGLRIENVGTGTQTDAKAPVFPGSNPRNKPTVSIPHLDPCLKRTIRTRAIGRLNGTMRSRQSEPVDALRGTGPEQVIGTARTQGQEGEGKGHHPHTATSVRRIFHWSQCSFECSRYLETIRPHRISLSPKRHRFMPGHAHTGDDRRPGGLHSRLSTDRDRSRGGDPFHPARL